MTIKIEEFADVQFGGKTITSIHVEPLRFVVLSDLWSRASRTPGKPTLTLQRERIRHQAHFMVGEERVVPDVAQLNALPLSVAKSIIAALDVDQGVPGSIVSGGDGITKPVIYKLGTPIAMSKSDKTALIINELEFFASTYGEVEDVLAAENEMKQTVALLQTVADPVEAESLSRLPGWAVDQISVADGVTIMNKVLPNF